jgi:hypothetical protein
MLTLDSAGTLDYNLIFRPTGQKTGLDHGVQAAEQMIVIKTYRRAEVE